MSERIERILHGSQASQPSKSLQGNFGLDEQYVELFIFPPGHQQAFDGCLNSILQQQQQHLWHKISRGSDFWNSLILLSLCSCNVILLCILSSAAVPSWFSSIFPSSSSFPSSFVLLQYPFPHKCTKHFFVVVPFFPLDSVLKSFKGNWAQLSVMLVSPSENRGQRKHAWRSPLRQNYAPGLWDLMRIYECSKA